MLDRFAKILTRKPLLIIAVAVMLLVPSLIGVIGTRINYDILSYLPDNLDSTKGQAVLEDTFQMAASSMLIIENMPEKDVKSLEDSIKEVPGVNDAIWIRDYLNLSIPMEMLPKELKDIFYSGNSTMILVKYTGTSSSEETMEAIEHIRGLMDKQCFLSGFSAIVKDTKDLADGEMPIYIVLAVVMSILAMMLCMESWVLPFVFMMGIFFAIVYNFGSNIFLGEISYVTKAIAAILQLGVTMDYSIFLIHRYDEELGRHDDKRDAMAAAIKSTFVSLLGSSTTTVAGFAALCFMRLTLGRDIGIVMMKGVVLGVITVVTVLPSLILVFDKSIHKYRHKSLIPGFDGVTALLLKHRYAFIAFFLIMFLPAFYAQSHTELYYNLDASLPEDLPSIVATNKLKDEFDMASTHFIITDDSIEPYKMNRMIKEVEKVEGIANVLAYDKVIGPVIPDSFIPQEIKDICKKDGKQIIMVNSKYKAAEDEENDQIDEITAIVKKYDLNAMVAGEGPLTKDLIEIAGHDFKVTNYISMAAIFIIIAICFKSLTVPLILVCVIELAIFINIGIPYFTGTVIPFISPTVIGCIQLGATVDYAILMTTRFREELRNGNDKLKAIKIASNTSFKSIVTSALVFFCSTLGVSIISKIEIIQSICTMLARGAIISAVIIMFVLSSILYVSEGLIAKTSYKWREPAKESNGEDKKKQSLKYVS